jgi:cyclopropane fatty-acyl-phospholipid synthase-like methyltransferase
MTQTSVTIRICPICQGSRKELLFRQQFQEISQGSLLAGYEVVVCQTCGFCFADNIPNQKAFDLYYREMSKYEHQDRSGQPSEFETRQFPALAEFIENYLTDPGARILEVGCANGGLLNALKQRGYQNVLGVEPSPVCARNAEKLYQIPVVTSALSDVHPEIGKFDFIILVAVLEHIRDLDTTITKLQDLLSPQGRLYIEVPDVTEFTSSPDAPFQEFSIEHINFFSSISLSSLMNSYGFHEISAAQIAYDQTETHTGHALRMVFQQGTPIKGAEIIEDANSKVALRNYIAMSQKVENRIHEIVNDLVDRQLPLIVWGVGTHTQRLLATSRLGRANILAFVDSNPNYQNKQIHHTPIWNPRQLAGTSADILVSSRIFQDEIVNHIRFNLKLKNELIVLYED